MVRRNRERGSMRALTPMLLFAILAFGVAVGLSPLVRRETSAATAASVQSGTTTMTAGAGSAQSVTATITTVDPTRSILFFNVRGDSDQPADGMVRGQITSGTTLTFTAPMTAA
jgi:hypothetical protein